MALKSSTSLQPQGRRHTTPMSAAGLVFTPVSGGGTLVSLSDPMTIRQEDGGIVSLPAGHVVQIYGGGGSALRLDNLSYCLFILPGGGQLYACREQDYLTISSAMDIYPRIYLRGPHELWLPPRQGGWTPGIATAPDAPPYWGAGTDLNGVLYRTRIQGGVAVDVNGTRIPIISGYVLIPGPAPGLFDIWVDALGNLSTTPGAVRICTVTVSTRVETQAKLTPNLPVDPLSRPVTSPTYGPTAFAHAGLIVISPSEYGTGTTVADGQGIRVAAPGGTYPIETFHIPPATSSPAYADPLTGLTYTVSTAEVLIPGSSGEPTGVLLWSTGDTTPRVATSIDSHNSILAGSYFPALFGFAVQPASSGQLGPIDYINYPLRAAAYQWSFTPGIMFHFYFAVPPP